MEDRRVRRTRERLRESLLELLGEKNQGSLCLVTLYPEMELKIKSRRNLKVLRWEVKR